MLSIFLRRRVRRLIAYTLILGLGISLGAFRSGGQAIWTSVISGFEFALSEDGGNGTYEALKFFVLADLTPFLIALSVMVLASFTIAFVAATVAITAIPVRLQAYVDGMAAMIGLILVFEGTELADPIRDQLGGVGTIAFYWAIMFSTSALVWNRLPFGFRYSSTAARDLPLDINTIADRLIPERDPTQELADISMRNRPAVTGEADVYMRMDAHNSDDHLSFELYHENASHFVKTQVMRYELFKVSGQDTTLQITATLTGLSPMTFWDFWVRPFTEDYADHISSRLTGTKDRSTYGRMQTAVRRKQEKKRLADLTA